MTYKIDLHMKFISKRKLRYTISLLALYKAGKLYGHGQAIDTLDPCLSELISPN